MALSMNASSRRSAGSACLPEVFLDRGGLGFGRLPGVTVLAFKLLTIPMPTIGIPLPRSMLRRSAGPVSTRPTSATGPGGLSAAREDEVLEIRDGSMARWMRTRKSLVLDSTLPAGSSMFSDRRAFSTSVMVRLRAASSLLFPRSAWSTPGRRRSCPGRAAQS